MYTHMYVNGSDIYLLSQSPIHGDKQVFTSRTKTHRQKTSLLVLQQQKVATHPCFTAIVSNKGFNHAAVFLRLDPVKLLYAL